MFFNNQRYFWFHLLLKADTFQLFSVLLTKLNHFEKSPGALAAFLKYTFTCGFRPANYYLSCCYFIILNGVFFYCIWRKSGFLFPFL